MKTKIQNLIIYILLIVFSFSFNTNIIASHNINNKLHTQTLASKSIIQTSKSSSKKNIEKPASLGGMFAWIFKNYTKQIIGIISVNIIFLIITKYFRGSPLIQFAIKFGPVLILDVIFAIYASTLAQKGIKKDKNYYDPILSKQLKLINIIMRPIRVVWLSMLAYSAKQFLKSFFNLYFPIHSTAAIFGATKFLLDVFPFMFMFFFISSFILVASDPNRKDKLLNVFFKEEVLSKKFTLKSILFSGTLGKTIQNSILASVFILPFVIFLPMDIAMYFVLIINFFGNFSNTYFIIINKIKKEQEFTLSKNQKQYINSLPENKKYKALFNILTNRKLPKEDITNDLLDSILKQHNLINIST